MELVLELLAYLFAPVLRVILCILLLPIWLPIYLFEKFWLKLYPPQQSKAKPPQRENHTLPNDGAE